MSGPNGFDPKDLVLPTEFVGQRVLCRPFHADDAQALLDIYDESREHLIRSLGGVEDVHTLADASAAIAGRTCAWDERIDLAVAIFDQRSNRLLGESGLGTDWPSQTFELGFWLSPSAEGHGYMAEANRLMCDWAFTGLDAQRVTMRCNAKNLRSIATAERIGLRQSGSSFDKETSEKCLSFEMTTEEYAQAPWKA